MKAERKRVGAPGAFLYRMGVRSGDDIRLSCSPAFLRRFRMGVVLVDDGAEVDGGRRATAVSKSSGGRSCLGSCGVGRGFSGCASSAWCATAYVAMLREDPLVGNCIAPLSLPLSLWSSLVVFSLSLCCSSCSCCCCSCRCCSSCCPCSSSCCLSVG